MDRINFLEQKYPTNYLVEFEENYTEKGTKLWLLRFSLTMKITMITKHKHVEKYWLFSKIDFYESDFSG